MLTDSDVRVSEEIDAETVCQIGAAADFFNTNRNVFNNRAYEIAQKGAAAKNALAQAIGMSPDYVDNCVHAHELTIVLEAKQDELEAELGGDFRRAAELPEPIVREVAKCFCAKSKEKKLDLADCWERLQKYTHPREDGQSWNTDLVRADLPHEKKAMDYTELIARFKKLLSHFEVPVTLGMSKRKQEIVFEIADITKQFRTQLEGLFEQLQKEG